jgi:hypothetical protein
VVKVDRSKEQKLDIIIIAVTLCLLLYAIGIVLNLFASLVFAPDVDAILAETAAVVLIIVMYSIAFVGKRKGVLSETPNIRVIDVIKEPDKAPTAARPTVNTQQVTVKNEPKIAEKKEQTAKQPVVSREKLICPACRKEFDKPSYMEGFTIDYGSPSNQPGKIVYCPHCYQLINLKQRSSTEEDVWE